MKSKLLKIIIVFIMLAFVYMTIVNALSFTATMTASSTTVAEATEFTITVKVSNLDVGTNGINTLSGYLKYDERIFQKINDTSIEGLNSWSPNYSADNGKITLTKNSFTKSEEEVFQVTFKSKTDVSGSSGTISFTSIVASNSEDNIAANDISTQITIGTTTGNTANNNSTPITGNNTNSTNSINPITNNTNSLSNSTNTNTNSNTNSNSNSNSTSSYNNTTNDDMPYTGVEDTLIHMIFVILVVAFIFYVKYERLNKEIKK